MNHRVIHALNALVIVGTGAVLLLPNFSVGQTPATATKAAASAPVQAAKPAAPATAAAKPAAIPRTPDGKPDLTGYWTNATYTPLERAANVTKQFFTEQEFETNTRNAAVRDEQQTTPGTTGDVHYDFTQFGLDKSQNTFAHDLRTAMITDPPDGRVPAQTPEAQKRSRDRAAAYKVPGAAYDSVQTISISSRCVIYNPPPGPPMLPQGYNGNYQIIQSPNYVMILFEQIGDIRIIPLDGRSAPPPTVRPWMGFSRGHWDGDTLVVETTNFSDRPEGRPRQLSGISDNFKLIERFKRIDDKTINYEFTVNDPETFVKPWIVNMPFTKINGPIFEPACHEGNYGMLDTMKGAREQDKKK